MRLSFLALSASLLSVYACKSEKTASSISAVTNASQIVNGNYTIKAVHSGLCLDVPQSSAANSVIMQQWNCNGTKAQLWKISRVDGNFVTITNVGNGKALDVTNWSQADGARIIQYPLGNNQANQQFSISGTNGQMTIRSRHSGKVLDVTDKATGQGAPIQQWTDYHTPNQLWSLTMQGNNPSPNPAPAPAPNPQNNSGFSSLLSEAQFNQLFPGRNPFYTYQGLVEAANATAGLAKEGSVEDRKREIAALLANGQHESDHFKATREYNTANYPFYCDPNNTQYPCQGGQQYYGRGPIQLSWNYNYGAAGKVIGVDLLRNPDLVATNPKIAWQTMLWFWMTQRGAGNMTPHEGIIRQQSFGETIRSINGALECGGKNPAQVNARVGYYEAILRVMGIGPGSGNTRC